LRELVESQSDPHAGAAAVPCDPGFSEGLGFCNGAGHAAQRGISRAQIFGEPCESLRGQARQHQRVRRCSARAADGRVTVAERGPIGSRVRRLSSAPTERHPEKQIVLGFGFEQPAVRSFEKTLDVRVPLDRELCAPRYQVKVPRIGFGAGETVKDSPFFGSKGSQPPIRRSVLKPVRVHS
jgi:hypothetical protein